MYYLPTSGLEFRSARPKKGGTAVPGRVAFRIKELESYKKIAGPLAQGVLDPV